MPFFLVLGVLVSGLVYQMASYTLRGHAVLTPRGFGALVVFAIVDGAAAAIAVGSVVGFSSSLWLLAGVCALLVFAVVAATAACQRLFGIAGTALAAFVVILLGASSSGAMAGPEFLPDAFRALSPLLPPGAGLGLIRGALYFDGAGMAGPAIVLLAWIAVSLGVTYGADVWSHERRVAVASAAG